MGYPRKSYPHRCSPPCAKRSRPRACARVYIIYRSPVGRSRGVSAPRRKRVRAVVAPCPAPSCAGWGRAKAKADAPSRSAEHAACVPNHCVQRRKCTRQSPPLPVRSPRGCLPTAEPPPADGRSAERRVGEGEGKGGRPLAQCSALARLWPSPLAQQPAPASLPPRPRRLNGSPGSAGGRENDRMAHRRTTTPTHQTPRGNDTCTIRVPRRKGAQSVVHNLYFSSSRPASFCTTFPQSCTDRPATRRKEHKSSLEGLIFRVLPPLFTPFLPKAIVQNTPAPPPFSPRKTSCFAPTRNRARTLASAGRDNTPRPAHSSRFQRDTNEAAAHEMPIFAPPKAENGGVFGLKC